ncbi:MAG: hypothetical protein Phyf2KO_09430 [Phycisphaerales bacterium]
MPDDLQTFSTVIALLAFAGAFVAAWFETAKRTPGTLIGLFGLCVLTVATVGLGPVWSFITFRFTDPIAVSTSITIPQLSGLAIASIGILCFSRRPVQVTLGDSPIKRVLESRSLDLRNARHLAESMLRSALGAKIVLGVEESPVGRAFIVKMVNGSIEQLFGAPASKLVNQRLDKVCPPHIFTWLEKLATEAIETKLPCQDERRFDGRHTQWFEMRAVAFPTGVTVHISDVTDRRRIEDALRREAMTDPLTGLANRAHLKRTLGEAVHRTSIKQGRGLSLFYIDFDRFKIINDSLGHDIGDELLCRISNRLREAVDAHKHSDVSILPARLGGDEFVVLAEGMGDPAEAEDFASDLINRFSVPYDIGDNNIVSTASIGLVTDHGSYQRAETILRDVDMAMYAAKEAGKGRYIVFEKGLRDRALSEATLENDLRIAVNEKQFDVAFQPIIDLTTGDVHSFEALIRWKHPVRGMVAPEQFIPLAEELDLITDIGEQVLRKACSAVNAILEATKGKNPIPVSVNHSKRELLSSRFVEQLADIIKETKTDPTLLKIEVTESVCVKHHSTIVPVLNGIRSLGVQTVVDDFGTGDSSFSCIEQFPLDQLKIDRRFLQSDRDLQTRKAILTSMIEMAQSLGVPAVCEGIETKDELDLMLSLGCDLGQGWVFAEAMPLDAAIELATSGLGRWIENMPLLEAIEANAKLQANDRRKSDRRAA